MSMFIFFFFGFPIPTGMRSTDKFPDWLLIQLDILESVSESSREAQFLLGVICSLAIKYGGWLFTSTHVLII